MNGWHLSSDWDNPMERSNPRLIQLWSVAGLSLVAGLLLSVRTLGGLSRTTELLARKTADSRELASLRLQAERYQALLDQGARYPATPTSYEALVRSASPEASVVTRTTASRPSVPGWSTQKITVEITNITGDTLGKIVEAGSAAKPPWALVESTLFASPVAGRVAKATLVLESVERQKE